MSSCAVRCRLQLPETICGPVRERYVMLSYNELTPAEAERLALLLEELGEAQQAIGKILRHGYESGHPDGGPTNRQALEFELGDVAAALQLMSDAGDIADEAVGQAEVRKLAKVSKYLHHQA